MRDAGEARFVSSPGNEPPTRGLRLSALRWGRIRCAGMRSAVLAFLLVSFVPQTRASSISDVPMEARFRSAAPVMMILLDDSLSMSGEVTAGGETACGVEYLFDDVGDHLRPLAGVAGKERMTWRYRWSGFNRLYYDPAVEYRPWPGAEEADPARPRSHPMHPAPTLGLDDTYFLYNSGTLYMTDSEARYSGHWTLIPGQAHVAVEAGNRAAYTPDIACAGLYEVFAYADPRVDCWDNQAAYTIVHEGKESPATVYRSQGPGTAGRLWASTPSVRGEAGASPWSGFGRGTQAPSFPPAPMR